jgi:hypothetical protein
MLEDKLHSTGSGFVDKVMNLLVQKGAENL